MYICTINLKRRKMEKKLKQKKNGQVIKRTDNGGVWKIANYVDDKLDGEYKIFPEGLGVCTEHKIYSKGKLIETIIDRYKN